MILYLFFFLIALLFSCSPINQTTDLNRGIDLSSVHSPSYKSKERRIALVVGNGNYQYVRGLANPTRDAELVSEALKQVGFDLHGGRAITDLNRTDLDQLIESFGESIRPGDVALFYYSGHGLQVAGENYLVPVDANIKKESEIRVKTVPVNLLFAKLDGIPNSVNIVVLDACRNNPFARSFRSSSGGLASVSAPTGTLVAFSTAPGQVAEDGSGINSTYSAALAKYVKIPGLSVENVFKKVRNEVMKVTNGDQTPWENTSLTGNFKFIDMESVGFTLLKTSTEKSAELERLLNIEAKMQADDQKRKNEINKRQNEIESLDIKITAIKKRLGVEGASNKNYDLDKMLSMIKKLENKEKELEDLRNQRENDNRRKRDEISRLKEEKQNKRLKSFYEDISKYRLILNSAFGEDMEDSAWKTLLSKYRISPNLPNGSISILETLIKLDLTYAEYLVEKRKKKEDFLAELMGSYVFIPDSYTYKGDTHARKNVAVKCFYMGKYEVTNWQYRNFKQDHFSPKHYLSLNNDHQPVVNVSWQDANDYAKWLSEKTGRLFRLPTENEWLVASNVYHEDIAWYENDRTCEYANVADLTAYNYGTKDWPYQSIHLCQDNHVVTAPVGSYKPNKFGLYDMFGNAQEWIGTNAVDKVARGGSWFSAIKKEDFSFSRNTFSSSNTYPSNFKDLTTGFRLVYEGK